MIENKRFHWLALVLIALAAFAVLAPGLGGPFVLDDFSNVVENDKFHPEEWNARAVREAVLTNSSGPTGRPVSMLTFVGNVMTTGMNPAAMKFTNAALHGITAILVGLLALRLFSAARMNLNSRQQVIAALLATSCWALHPIAVTSTLYVVQRMNLLAVMFTVAALLAYLRARPWFFRSLPRAAGWSALAVVFWLLGLLSKESAVLAPLYLVLIEWLVFAFRDDEGTERAGWRRLLLGTTIAGTLVAATMFLLTWDQWSAQYDTRAFSLTERLLTEARVFWHYVGMILLPGHSKLGLYLDDIPLSTGLLTPWTTLLSLAGLLAWIGGAFLVRKRAPLVSFGLFFFLAGHLLESTVIPLEIAFEHRNYLPSIGLLIALAAAVMLLARRLELRQLEWLPLAALGLFLAFFTVIRSVHWSDNFMLAQLETYHHPQSPRAHAQLGFVYTQFARRTSSESGWPAFYLEAAADHFEKSAHLDSNSRVPLFLWHLHARAHGQPFPDKMYHELLDRLRSGKPTPDTPGSLDMTLTCVLEGCGVPAGELETMLRLTLENPRVQGRNRSETLVVAAKYFAHARKDPGSAVSLLAQAVEASPSIPRFRLFLARQSLQLGNLPEAREQIDKIASLDTWGTYKDELAEITTAIQTAETQAGANSAKTFDRTPGEE